MFSIYKADLDLPDEAPLDPKIRERRSEARYMVEMLNSTIQINYNQIEPRRLEELLQQSSREFESGKPLERRQYEIAKTLEVYMGALIWFEAVSKRNNIQHLFLMEYVKNINLIIKNDSRIGPLIAQFVNKYAELKFYSQYLVEDKKVTYTHG